MNRLELILTAERLLNQIISYAEYERDLKNYETGLVGDTQDVFYLKNFRELFREIIQPELFLLEPEQKTVDANQKNP